MAKKKKISTKSVKPKPPPLEPELQEKIPWDDTFKQFMSATLRLLGLKTEEDVKLGKLPLKADLVIIRTDDLGGEWQQHPLWKHCQRWNLVEFKSVVDPVLFGDVETWFAYTLLYRKKFEIAYEQGLAAWLIVEYRNKQLEQALSHYHIELKAISPGFWQAQSLFPIYIVAYRELPFDLPYSTLKLFLKSGKPVQEVFESVLRSKLGSSFEESFKTAMELIHPLDAKEVLERMSLAAERQLLKETAMKFVQEDVEQREQKSKREGKLEGKLENAIDNARKILERGMDLQFASDVTGLSMDELKQHLGLD